MEPVTLDQLEWIHRSELRHLMFRERSLELAMTCPFDLGHAPWAGKTLLLTAIGLHASEHLVVPAVGPEFIDQIGPGLSPGLQYVAPTLRSNVAMWIAFHSGSSLSLICDRLAVTVVS